MRVTDKDLERELKRLNDTYGFKGYGMSKLKSGKYKAVGKGFSIYGAYGGVQLVFKKAPTGSQRNISSRMSKRELFEYMQTMREAIRLYKGRTKM